MTRAIRPVRPPRRALLAGALIAPVLGLAGCRPEEKDPAPRPPAGVELTPLTSAGELMAPHPVLLAAQPLGAGEGRPLGLVLATYRDYASSASVITVDVPAGHPVPIAKDAVGLRGCARPDAAVLLVERPAGATVTYDLHVSGDLVTWSTSTVSGTLRRPIAALGDGVAVFELEGAALRVARLADDGALTDLAPVTFPEAERWSAVAVAAHESTIVIVCTRPGADPVTVASVDAGASWGAPVALTTDGQEPSPIAITVQQGTFVVVGTHSVDPGEVAGAVRYDHPVAWSSTDGRELRMERVPLPTFGREGYERADGTPIDPSSPLADQDYRVGEPSLGEGGGVLSVGLGHEDTYEVAQRRADGSWSVGGSMVFVDALVRRVLADAGGAVLLSDEQVWVHAAGSGPAQAALEIGAERSSEGTGSAATSAGGGTTRWATSAVKRVDADVAWTSTDTEAWFSIAGDRLSVVADAPVRGDDTFGALLGVADDGLTGLFVEPLPALGDGSFARGAQGWVRPAGGAWTAVSGLPSTGSFSGQSIRRLEGAYWLAGGTARNRLRPEDSPWSAVLWTSTDAVTWQPVGSFPEDTLATDVALLGDEVVVVGVTAVGEQDQRAVLFRRSGEGWTPTPLGSEARSQAQVTSVVAGELQVHGTEGDRRVAWTIAADGSASQTYAATELESRGPILDLGDGALLATGWRRSAAGGGGAVIWVSSDGGEHWDTTPIPGEAGRSDDADLVRDGEDVVVVVSTPDGPHGYRITDARADVLSATTVRGASDAGG